ncbi:MAG: hypothetical protein ACE5G3_04420, partial [Gammaproteobacteria bacterium]
REWERGFVQQARAGLVDIAEEVASLDEDRIHRIADEARGFPVSVISWRANTAATLRTARTVVNIAAGNKFADRSID